MSTNQLCTALINIFKLVYMAFRKWKNSVEVEFIYDKEIRYISFRV